MEPQSNKPSGQNAQSGRILPQHKASVLSASGQACSWKAHPRSSVTWRLLLPNRRFDPTRMLGGCLHRKATTLRWHRASRSNTWLRDGSADWRPGMSRETSKPCRHSEAMPLHFPWTANRQTRSKLQHFRWRHTLRRSRMVVGLTAPLLPILRCSDGQKVGGGQLEK